MSKRTIRCITFSKQWHTTKVLLAALAIASATLLAPGSARAGIMRYVAIGSALSASHAYAKHRGGVSAQVAPNPATASLGPTDGDICKAHLPMGTSPKLDNPKWADGLTVLCFSEYTVAFSPKTKTALWSAEYLTRARLDSARTFKRRNTFHEEPLLPVQARSTLKDYVRSGYDRGHLSPSGDASNPASQNETFSLANIVPQEPNNNRHVWQSIESGSRNYVKEHGALNVITGPLFIGAKISFINDRVAVPTHLWKLVYDPVKKSGGVFLVQNIDTKDINWQSIAEFEQFSGYRFNLGRPAVMQMPPPRQHF